ncbi:MAG: ATP-binding protein [Succinivibrio sp.]|nr:ATP-binding protein [Succinivibrio sp.]
MQYVPRTHYLEFLQRHRDRQIIKVVSGIRRCGKSTLLELFRQQLAAEGIGADHIIAINFEDLAFEELQDYHALYDYIVKSMQPQGMNYIFLDEIQHVPFFEKVVDSLFIKDNADVYITGSNAFFMSGELSTLLSGRYVELRMLPLSFAEYHAAGTLPHSQSRGEIFERYLKDSSFPYTLQLAGNTEAIREYLLGIYHSVILNDVVGRLHIADVKLLESVVKYLFAHVGSLMSMRKIADSLNSLGRKADSKTVERYVTGLEDSLLIYRCERFDVKGKELLKLNPKYYLADVTLRSLLLSSAGRDLGHLLENVVYLELLRRGYEVYVGTLPQGEIDFVARNRHGLCYFQVAASVMQPEVLNRELTPLIRIRDNYPKYLLSLDDLNADADFDGIRQLNALQWLLHE